MDSLEEMEVSSLVGDIPVTPAVLLDVKDPLLLSERAAQAVAGGTRKEQKQLFAGQISAFVDQPRLAGGNELAEAVILVCRPFQGFRHFQGHEHRIDVGIARQRLMANGRYAPLNDKGGALRHLGQIKLPIKELPAGGRRCEHNSERKANKKLQPAPRFSTSLEIGHGRADHVLRDPAQDRYLLPSGSGKQR